MLFYLLLATLLWLPLPEASRPDWAMVILSSLVYTLAAFATVSWVRGRLVITPAFRAATPLHIGFILVMAWMWFQQIPLPMAWVQALSPSAAEYSLQAQAAMGLPAGTYGYLSLAPEATHFSALLTTAYYLLFCLTLLLVDSRKRLEQLLMAFVAAGTFQAVFGSLSTLSGAEWLLFREKTSYLGVASGTFVNRNSFSGFLEMTLAAGMGLLIARLQNNRFTSWRERLMAALQVLMSNKVLLRSALAIMVIGLVMSRSRMGNTAFFSSLMVTGLIYVVIQRKLTRGMVFLFASLLIIDTVIISQWFGLEQVMNRLERTSMERETRPNVAHVTLDMIKDNGLTGTGGGSYYTALPHYHDGSWGGFYDLAHNDYLQFPAEMGVPAFLILAAMVLFCLYKAFRAMGQKRKKLYQGAGFASFMGILAILIHATVDFNLQMPANAAYFVVLMAVSLIAHSRSKAS
ncbi:O-antigen ligase family protein [Sansalvadorimonas verongulae]|uniref:O-antigen ligase family protein n=1 Tax=Sansalvadorimonas verongulae TaxID=2172824 RepID=UPI0012BC222A|nr:O-antigen ligase family protein [Sansalvadorimonas verongulae]MTI12912.1 O-antigen ligase family protein [Sansalvadorimonas verongulae]